MKTYKTSSTEKRRLTIHILEGRGSNEIDHG